MTSVWLLRWFKHQFRFCLLIFCSFCSVHDRVFIFFVTCVSFYHCNITRTFIFSMYIQRYLVGCGGCSLETLLPLCSANCWVLPLLFFIFILTGFCAVFIFFCVFRFVCRQGSWRGKLGFLARRGRSSAFQYLFECVNFCYLHFLGIFLWQFHSWSCPTPCHANFDSFVKSFYCDLLQLQVQVL